MIVLLAALALAACLGLLWRRSSGHFRGAATPSQGEPPGDERTADGTDGGGLAQVPIDVPGARGERATLLQFSSVFCAPCRSTRRTLAEVAAMVPGVTHVEVDAEAHLDMVRQLRVMRTPTTFVLDAEGAVVSRASGQPRKADVIAAIARATS